MHVRRTLLMSIMAFAFIAVVFMFSGNPVEAATTFVAGTVTAGGNPVDAANVSAVCHHSDGDHTATTTTEPDGTYAVSFPDTECAPNDMATVTATKGPTSGSNSGKVNHFALGGGVTLDIAIVNVAVPVPEFGMITGAIAMITSAGYFFGFKKRLA